MSFKSDNMALLDLMSSHFTVRQTNDIRQFFAGAKDPGGKLMDIVVHILRKAEKPAPDAEDDTKIAAYSQSELDKKAVAKELTGGDMKYLRQLQAQMTAENEFFLDTQLGSEHSKRDFRMVMAILRDEGMSGMLFPLSNVDELTNEQRHHSVQSIKDGKVTVKVKSKRRK